MTLHSVNLTGQEHLPPALCLLADSSFKYSSQLHTIDPKSNEHTYTIIVSAERLSLEATTRLMTKTIDGPAKVKPPIGHVVSQISSTATSARQSSSDLKPIYMKAKIEELSPKSLRSIETTSSEEQIPSLNSWNGKESLPRSLPDTTYWSPGFAAARAEKMISMVHVEFHLIHQDVAGKRAIVVYSDEFPTDSTMGDVIHNFHRMCARKLNRKEFNPIISYCAGSMQMKPSKSKSRPLGPREMRNTIGQLAKSSKVEKITLMVNNID